MDTVKVSSDFLSNQLSLEVGVRYETESGFTFGLQCDKEQGYTYFYRRGQYGSTVFPTGSNWNIVKYWKTSKGAEKNLRANIESKIANNGKDII